MARQLEHGELERVLAGGVTFATSPGMPDTGLKGHFPSPDETVAHTRSPELRADQGVGSLALHMGGS
jgi:hypothetical protein